MESHTYKNSPFEGVGSEFPISARVFISLLELVNFKNKEELSYLGFRRI